MEQVVQQQIVEPIKAKKKSLALPIAALCCGMLGFFVGWLAYAAFFTLTDLPLFGDVLHALTPSLRTLRILRSAGGLLFVLSFVFGLIGLIRSACRPFRIAGIVLSGVGLFAGAICGFEVLMSIIMITPQML